MKNRLYIILLTLIAFSSSLSSKDIPFNNLHFEHITVDEGLSSGKVNDIIQDNEGFLWIGTINGLNKYDGNSFMVYRNDPNDSNSLSDNHIICLYEDKKGIIWIGTETGGLNKYNKETEQFTSYQNNPNDSTSIYENRVWSIYEDNNGFLWVITGGCINKYDRKNNTFTHHHYHTKNNQHLKPKVFFEDDFGQLWVGTWGSGLCRLDNQKDSIIFIADIFNQKEISKNISSITQNKNRHLLYACYGEGFNKLMNPFNERKYKIINYKHSGNNPNSLINNNVNDIFIDNKGLIWSGTEGGISILNEEKNIKSFYNIKRQFDNPKSLNNNYIRCIHQDRSGVYWIGTWGGGLNKYAPKKRKIKSFSHKATNPNSISDELIVSLCEDNNSNIWLASWGDGLMKFDRKNNNFIHYRHQKNDPSTISDNYIKTLFIDSGNRLWIGTRNNGVNLYLDNRNIFKSIDETKNMYITCFNEDKKGNILIGTRGDGLLIYDTQNSTIRNYQFQETQNSISGNNILNTFLDSHGNIWIATYYNGISKYNIKKDSFTKYKYKPYEQDKSNHYTTSHRVRFWEDDNHTLWLGTPENGLLRFFPDDSIIHYPYRTLSIFNSKQGDLWFGTKKGLKKYISEKDSFITYHNGIASNEIFGILEDKVNNLWLITNYGVLKFNPQNHGFKNYNIDDGLLDNSFADGRFIMTQKNELVLTSQNGLNIIEPDKLKKNSFIPKVVLTGLSIYNNRVTPGEKINGSVVLKKSITFTKEITLTHKINAFTIHYAALDFTAPQKNKYIYQLKGFDKNQTITEKNFITYTNLGPGNYIFRVIGSNNDGVWNQRPTELSITILPPFWERWWFKTIIITGIISIIGFYFLSRVIRYRKQNIKLNQLVSERTESLERSNMTKDKILSIISHDLKNPINAISGFGGLLQEKYKKYSDEKRLEFIKQITNASENVKSLVDNLLHWSRQNTNRIEYDPEIIDLYSIVRENMLYFDLITNNKNIKIEVEEEKYEAYADRYMITTVIRNLMANAIKYSYSGGTIQINFEETKRHIKCNITDHGTGMDKETQKSLFDQLNIVSQKGTEGEAGTGLGLMICKEFINQNKGEIFIKSDPGKGSTFSIQLPRNNNNH